MDPVLDRPSNGRRQLVRLLLCLLLLIVVVGLRSFYYHFLWKNPGPKIPIGKDTTLITEPVDEEGYLDFEGALNARLKGGITPETNANVLIWHAIGQKTENGSRGSVNFHMPSGYFQALEMAEPPAEGEYFVNLGIYLTEQKKLPAAQGEMVVKQKAGLGKEPWLDRDQPLIASWLEANQGPLAIVVEATKRPSYYNPIISPRFPNGKSKGMLSARLSNVYSCKELATALLARAMLRISLAELDRSSDNLQACEAKYDQAWEDLQSCHRLGRMVGSGGSMVEFLTGMRIDISANTADLVYLELAPLSAQKIEKRLNEMQKLPAISNVSRVLDE